jgi:adenylate kinase family enzyme
MGFFDALRRVLHRDAGGPARSDLASAWGLTEDGADAGPTKPSDLAADATAYDRAQWQKKMKRILDELPGSQAQWAELMAEAKALNLDPDWVTRCQIDEFMLLIRRAVSDRHFTEAEHRKLDLARDLIGIPETEAEAALNSVIAEAESFFGKSVKDT